MGDLLEELDSLRALGSGHSSANVASGSNNRPHGHAPPPLNSIRQDILKQLDALGREQGQILQEWPELKSAWNRSLVITQFPNEILFQIFVYFSAQPQAKDSSEYHVQHGEGFLERGLVKTELMKLTFVCRRWRDVALATPALWRTIDMSKSSDWMNLALTRSGNATIDVSFPFDFSEEHASLLTPHCYRLRSLCLQAYSPYAIRIIRNILPALETLEIGSNWHMGLNSKELCTDLGLTPERFPNIRALQLVQNIIPGDPSFYARLRKLSLKACYFKTTVDLNQFVQLLAASLYLEHLELDEFLQDLSGSRDAESGAAALPLSPSLISLRLSNHSPVLSARFLSRFVVPPTTSISIKSFIPLVDGEEDDIVDFDEEERTCTLRTAVPASPRLASSLPGLATITRARLTIEWDDRIECFSAQMGRCRDGCEASILDIYQATPNSLQMVDGLTDLLVLLGSSQASPLAHLEIISRDCSVGAEMWATVFRSFPCLVSLAASADGALFDGLHVASLAGPAEGLVACQGLERVRINDHWRGLGTLDEPFESLIDCLRWRADRGNRLAVLTLDLRRGLVEDVKTYLPRLEELVAKVEEV